MRMRPFGEIASCERGEAVSSPHLDRLNPRLLLGVFAQPLGDILGAEDVAGRIRRDTFAARLVVVRVGARDEIFDRPVLGIADPDAAAAARISWTAFLVLGPWSRA